MPYIRVREGNLLRTWGEGIFPRAHGVFMAPDATIWLTDDADHTVRQCTLDEADALIARGREAMASLSEARRAGAAATGASARDGALGTGRGVSLTPGVLPPKEVRLPNMVVLPF